MTSFWKRAASMPTSGNTKQGDFCWMNDMAFEFFSKNGEIIPTQDARVPLLNIEYQYGFGVYETIRVVDGAPLFLRDHTERLLGSAQILGLEHVFDDAFFEESMYALIEKNAINTCNIKVLLIGAKSKEDAS